MRPAGQHQRLGHCGATATTTSLATATVIPRHRQLPKSRNVTRDAAWAATAQANLSKSRETGTCVTQPSFGIWQARAVESWRHGTKASIAGAPPGIIRPHSSRLHTGPQDQDAGS